MYPYSYNHKPFSYVLLLIAVVLFSRCADEPEVPPIDVLTTADKLALLTDFQKETVDYFQDISLGFEFGNASRITRKWTSPVKINVEGDAPPALLAELDLIIEELNALFSDGHEVRLSSGDESSNFRIFFGSGDEYAQLNPDAAGQVGGNRGLFYVNWNSSQNLTFGDMYVDIVQIEEVFQRHLLREELTQALGLAMDSPRYSQSIFQTSWTSVTSYMDIDEELIRLLYHPEMVSGLNAQEVRRLLIDILYEEL